eukprot:TRINITY_DN4518_c0_g1_i2.p1 TRINITY_DN4518_c0_g1~~TRINITY_DN4518_c0_g1_i2.p1  ORF type:complete len:298 (+),score=31.57 TRINITY_DN4518_c0_g1_i2:424-1317(+)
MKLISISEIRNDDLSNQFNLKWRELPHLKPILVYHGTAASNITSISRRGLLVPGPTTGIRVVNGSANGVGIYLGNTASISMPYVREGKKLLVCALLPSSAVRDCGTHYVSFDSACVLPCFVAQFGDGFREQLNSPSFYSETAGIKLMPRNSRHERPAPLGVLGQSAIILHVSLSVAALLLYFAGSLGKVVHFASSLVTSSVGWSLSTSFELLLYLFQFLCRMPSFLFTVGTAVAVLSKAALEIAVEYEVFPMFISVTVVFGVLALSKCCRNCKQISDAPNNASTKSKRKSSRKNRRR